MARRKQVAGASVGAKGFSAPGSQRSPFAKDRGIDRLYEALKAARVISFDWEMASDVVVRSPNADEIFGEATRGSGKAFFEGIHGEDRERLKGMIGALTPGNPEYKAAYRCVRRSDGEEIILEETGRGEFDTEGKLVRVWGMARDLTESKQTERDLRQSKDLSEAVNRISQAMHSSLDTDEVLRRIVKEGAAALGSNTAAISERKDGGWVVRYAYGIPAELIGQRLEDEQERHGVLAIETREVVPVEDAFNDERFNREHLRRYNVRSVLVAPVIIRGEPFGVIFFNYHQALHAFTEAELNFGRQLASNAASALGNARLFEERRRAAEALAAERDKATQLLDIAGVMILTLDLEGKVTVINRKGCEILGCSSEEVVGKDWVTTFLPKKTRPELAAAFRKLAGGKLEVVEHLENAVLTREGQERIIAWHNTVIRGNGGEIVGTLSSGEDITERKRAEGALRKSEERWRQAAELVGLRPYVWDPTTSALEWSEGLKALWGLPPDAPVNHDVWMAGIHPEDRATVEERVARCLDPKGDGIYEAEYRVRGADGVERWVAARGITRFAEGKPATHLGVALEVTQRKQAERELAEQSRLLDLSNDAIFVRDPKGRVTYWNKGAEDLYGYRREEALGKEAKELLRAELPEDLEAIQERMRREGRWEGELIHRRKDGSRVTVLSRWAADYGSQGELRAVLETNNDITLRKEAETVLKRSKEDLEKLVGERTARLQELVGELEHVSYTITHDMRAPLRAMRAFAEMLKDESSGGLGEVRRGFVARIIAGAERMDALITDALNYTKTVRTELPVGPVDVGRLLRGMLDTYPQFQIGEAEITVERELPMVIGNEAGLTQTFSNLLDNAVKFTKPGEEPRIRVWGERVSPGTANADSEVRSPRPDGEWVRIWVEDKGIGISREMLPRVFDMFAHGSSSRAGTGIGLALVRKVVDRMGGRIGAKSEVGRGSRFWIELRAGDMKQSAAETVRAALSRTAGTGG